jgi:hypothetical protein
MSHRSGLASSASSMGLANASPTIAMLLTPSRSMVSSSSAMSKRRLVSVTTEPPRLRMPNDEKAPVPCISGHAGRVMGPGRETRFRTASRSGSSGSCMVDSLKSR